MQMNDLIYTRLGLMNIIYIMKLKNSKCNNAKVNISYSGPFSNLVFTLKKLYFFVYNSITKSIQRHS